MKRNKKISSIFDQCHVSESQDVYLQRCGFAVPGQPPPDSDPSVGVSSPPLNEGIASHLASDDSETDSVIGSGYDEVAVESQAIRFVSPEPEESTDTVEDAADPVVEVLAEKQSDVPVESNNRRDERLRKKLKIPLREVVKAIVINSRNTEEIEKTTSCVQILLNKGFRY